MKKCFITIFAFVFFLVVLNNSISAQKLGTRKNVTLVLQSYECGDFCYLELKDEKNGNSYSLDNIDDKTKDGGILEKIQNIYYKNNESDKKLKGRKYLAVIEYRKTDEYKFSDNIDEGPIKTGKKITKWMINSLSGIPK
jgi:hypothetical protein